MKKSEDIEILQVITALDVGGAERVVLELSNGLEENTKSVGIVHLLNQTKILEQYDTLSYPIFNLMINRKFFLSFIWGLFKLNKIVRENKVKIIHAHMFHALLFTIIIKIFNPKIKLVFTSHNFKGFNSIRKLIIKVTKKIRNIDVVFSENQHIDINAKKTLIIPNGVKERKNKIYKNKINKKFIFINVASLTEQKNHLLLINEFYKLKDSNAELWILGDGILKEDIVNQISKFDLSSKVKLLGIQENINYYLEQADCFVLSSKWEGLPMALLEAAMVGLPVISTPVGAVPELLENNRGYIATRENLSTVMEHVLNHPEEAHTRALNLQQWVKSHYSAQSMVNKHEILYKELCKC